MKIKLTLLVLLFAFLFIIGCDDNSIEPRKCDSVETGCTQQACHMPTKKSGCIQLECHGNLNESELDSLTEIYMYHFNYLPEENEHPL